MKICVFGAGAVGGYLGVMLARAGCEVSLVARGPHLAAIQQNGLTLWRDGKSQTHAIVATDSAAELGPQDFVLVTLKAHALPGVVADIGLSSERIPPLSVRLMASLGGISMALSRPSSNVPWIASIPAA